MTKKSILLVRELPMWHSRALKWMRKILNISKHGWHRILKKNKN